MSGDFETHLFVIWDKGRRVAEQRILSDIRKRFQIVFVGEMSFPCSAQEGYCRFYGSRGSNLVKKAAYCGKGPFLLVVVKVTELHKFVDQEGKVVNALMFSRKKTYRRWSGGFFRVHGTLQPEEFERDIYKLTGHHAAEWRKGVPTGLHMELPPLESLPAPSETDEKKGCGARRSKGFRRICIVNAVKSLVRIRFLRHSLRRPFLNLIFGLSVRRKAAQVGRGLNVNGPCSITRRTAIGVCVSIGSLAVFCGGELTIGDNVHISSDVNVITMDCICDDDDERKRLRAAYRRSGVTIGDSASIGANVTILPGTSIGRGAIVQNGSVVQGYVPDFAVYGGTPGRIIQEGIDAGEEECPTQNLCVKIGKEVGAKDLEMLVDRHNGPLHRCVLSGTWHGKPCIVKWTDNAPVSITNEYEVGKAFYEASSGRSPKMYSLVRRGHGAACVMERMCGTDLMSFMSRLPDADRRIPDIAGQIARLFDVMHRIGMCHRDLHPRNIFVDSNGIVKLFDFQNSALSSRREDPFSKTHDVSRKFIYECRSPHNQVVGLYNDCEHLLARLGDSSPLRRELLRIWRDGARDFDYYCPVGAYHAARFAFRSIGVMFRTMFCKKRELDKLREKLAVTWPTLRYWIRHGVTGRSGFVAEKVKKGEMDHVG